MAKYLKADVFSRVTPYGRKVPVIGKRVNGRLEFDWQLSLEYENNGIAAEDYPTIERGFAAKAEELLGLLPQGTKPEYQVSLRDCSVHCFFRVEFPDNPQSEAQAREVQKALTRFAPKNEAVV